MRLAHRVKELEELPRHLSEMPSIIKVKNWYAESFQDLVDLQVPALSNKMKQQLMVKKSTSLPHNVPNPSLLMPKQNYPTLHAAVPIGHR